MTDMLVRLYDLPDPGPALKACEVHGVRVRRALAPEKHVVVAWVRTTFSEAWASECEAAFSRSPVSCFVAVRKGDVLGFAVHDATCLDFFGPTGVAPWERDKGIGRALLLSCLHAMAAQGYAYAVIGSASVPSYYEKAVGAVIIEGSSPGIYKGLLK